MRPAPPRQPAGVIDAASTLDEMVQRILRDTGLGHVFPIDG
ncbi:hypothetical protein [Streptomyces sp. S.PB5]|nr:hypothetical protein [Streptomyces sp. S.PB5]MDN3027590.1 hypothetical protein [Streptomyces sp. S.PB5]